MGYRGAIEGPCKREKKLEISFRGDLVGCYLKKQITRWGESPMNTMGSRAISGRAQEHSDMS